MGGKRKRQRPAAAAPRLPKGLAFKPQDGVHNPFDTVVSARRSKFPVHSRQGTKQQQSIVRTASSLADRTAAVVSQYVKKTNTFKDARLARHADRVVRQRHHQSKRRDKYSLQQDEALTHKGRPLDRGMTEMDPSWGEDQDTGVKGTLDEVDTALHFGGGSNNASKKSKAPANPYGPAATAVDNEEDKSLTQYYGRTRPKDSLEEVIARSKRVKAASQAKKERQVQAFDRLDDSFAELKGLLDFGGRGKPPKPAAKVPADDEEMEDWEKEMRGYMQLSSSTKVKATDRTETPEEIAKRESERLHALETRRLARMNGEEVSDDDYSDIDDDSDNERPKKRKKLTTRDNPEHLTDSEDEEQSDDHVTPKFTPDGLVHVNQKGEVVVKVGEATERTKTQVRNLRLASELDEALKVGMKVEASYRAKEQYDGNESWYTGVVAKVNRSRQGDSETTLYDVEYDDGDFEEDVEPCHVRVMAKTIEEKTAEEEKEAEVANRKKKREKAREKARSEMPFVFEVPTTLEALHEFIRQYASIGSDASLVVERIYKSNTVRLDKRNVEKMQNFYDVLIRRFVAVGDAIGQSGDGGIELGRFGQLDKLLHTMYDMSQDSPSMAIAVWGRRLGVFQNAHAKRLRDAEFVAPDDEKHSFSAWPSLGVVLALRVIGHIFPVTDARHKVVTPCVLFLGQLLGYTPILSIQDAVLAVTCAGIMLDFTKEARRFVPECNAFIAGLIRLFAVKKRDRMSCHPMSSAEDGEEHSLSNLRSLASRCTLDSAATLSLHQGSETDANLAAALLHSALHLGEISARILNGGISDAEKEALSELTNSVLALDPKNKKYSLNSTLTKKIASVATTLSEVCKFEIPRTPVQRRMAPTTLEKAIVSLAPRLEDPERFSMRKKSKTADRVRREYKREHKAVARELRLDGAAIERARRKHRDDNTSAARSKRNKAFAWMEGEQATMNQQVRQGGGLLQGGGMGAARAKAATAKLGIKKGGKF